MRKVLLLDQYITRTIIGRVRKKIQRAKGEVESHVYAVVQEYTPPVCVQAPLQCEYNDIRMKTKDINERIQDHMNVYETIRETVDCVGAEDTGL